jgi:hypothetical protein
MLGKNNTPFAAIGFEQMHRDGDRMAIIAARGRFELSADGRLAVAAKQEIVLADECQGEPLKATLTKVSDLVPFRPATDITVQGVSYPSQGETPPNWTSFWLSHGHRRSGSTKTLNYSNRRRPKLPAPFGRLARSEKDAGASLAHTKT